MDNQACFIHLPDHVRRKIYLQTQLIANSRINISRRIRFPEWSQREKRLIRWSIDFWPLVFPNQLFYVSRSVSEEARRVFFSANSFELSLDEDGGFQYLINAGPLAWASLSNVQVNIDQQLCHAIWGDCSCKARLITKGNGPVEHSAIFSAWRQLCVQLGPHLKDDQLSIHVACGAVSKATAATFLDALSELPRLKDLSIRLGPHRNLHVLSMILEAIKRKTKFFETRNRPTKETFPFLKLPVELQIRVLEYTDLTESKPLMLLPPYHWFAPSDCFRYECNANTDDWDQAEWDNWCPAKHAAFSTVYSCWKLPGLLLIGNKHIRDIAIQIYYSTNVFHLLRALPNPEEEPPETWRNGSPNISLTPWSPQTSGFLCGFPDYSWAHLRHIHWTFQDMHHNAFRVNYKGIRSDWLKTIAVLRENITPGKLTIEIDLSPPTLQRYEPEDAKSIALTWALYDQIVEPITWLSGLLKDFFVHCYFPTDHDSIPLRINQEYVLECWVMGQEYDSLARGKQYTEPAIPE
ncbi:hypothetical protein BDV06DRAFT_204848 [Aspergillus oleicola]